MTDPGNMGDRALEKLGASLKRARVSAGLNQRDLAGRLGVTPSLISQFERGLSRPSAGTLFALVTELGISLDRLIHGDKDGRLAELDVGSRPIVVSVVRADERRLVELSSGVRWEALASRPNGVDFFEVIYETGAAATTDQSLIWHRGHEYGYVITGELWIEVGTKKYLMTPGDAISFNSRLPHRLWNDGVETVHAIWLILGADESSVGGLHEPADT